MTQSVVETVLASALATAGTFTVAYPTGKDSGSFERGTNHKVVIGNNSLDVPGDCTIAFGASLATVTYNGATTMPAGTPVWVQLDEPGTEDGNPDLAGMKRMAFAPSVVVELGSPLVADVDGVCESQSDTGAHTLTLDGAFAGSDGVVTLDVPRNVVADSGGADTAVLTITGTDEYGAVVVENITLNGTTAVPGKKAFKTITSVTSSATIANGAFLGTGDVLGLPVYVGEATALLAEGEDGAAATAGTLVTGLDPNTKSTATTADVRGTYDPNSAADGGKSFTLVFALPDPKDKGNPQFAG